MKKQYVLTVFVDGNVRLDMLTQDQILAKCRVQDKNVRRWGIIPKNERSLPRTRPLAESGSAKGMAQMASIGIPIEHTD